MASDGSGGAISADGSLRQRGVRGWKTWGDRRASIAWLLDSKSNTSVDADDIDDLSRADGHNLDAAALGDRLVGVFGHLPRKADTTRASRARCASSLNHTGGSSEADTTRAGRARRAGTSSSGETDTTRASGARRVGGSSDDGASGIGSDGSNDRASRVSNNTSLANSIDH